MMKSDPAHFMWRNRWRVFRAGVTQLSHRITPAEYETFLPQALSLTYHECLGIINKIKLWWYSHDPGSSRSRSKD